MKFEDLITKHDLQEFEQRMIEQFGELLQSSGRVAKKWLRTAEVQELLGLSSSSIQNLRINGTLPFTKVGGTIFYQYADIERIMQENLCKTDLPQ